ncbi:MAG: hypothetical protein ACFB0D_22205 [Phormidesmis sp.]
MLEGKGYPVKDQTRRGKSASGKSAGELDIFVQEKNGAPFTIIEALNLKSTDKGYIDLHLKKIFDYDTAGCKHNFILVYSRAQNFSQLCRNYLDYLPFVDYPYPLHDTQFSVVVDLPFSDIKIVKATHIRNEEEVSLFHVIIDLNKE